jgi:hypothetical protein
LSFLRENDTIIKGDYRQDGKTRTRKDQFPKLVQYHYATS